MAILFASYWVISSFLGTLYALDEDGILVRFLTRLPNLYCVIVLMLVTSCVVLFSWAVLPIIVIYTLVKTFPDAKSATIESLKECLAEKED